MGRYVTSTSISLILPGFLKSNTMTSDTEGTAIFMRQVENAEAEVDSVITSRYDITGFTSTSLPPLLRKLTEDIAIGSVIKKTGYRSDDRNEYMDDFGKAQDILEDLKEGKRNLTHTNGSSVAGLSSKRFLSSTKDYTPTAGQESQQDWKLDFTYKTDRSNAKD